MNWHGLGMDNGTELVDWFADHIHHASERAAAHGHGNRSALVDSFHAAHHALGCFHGDATHAAFAQMLLHLNDDIDWEGNCEAIAHNAKRLINRGHVGFCKLHVHCRASDLNYVSDIFWHSC